MSTDFVENSFLLDLDENDDNETIYPSKGIQWVKIDDADRLNYANGWINWNSSTLVGSTHDYQFDPKQTYLQIPYGCVLSLPSAGTHSFGKSNAGGTDAFQHVVENCFAVTPKGDHTHIIDSVNARIDGIAVTRGTQYANVMMNEVRKTYSREHEELFHESTNFDDADSYNVSTTLLETNNRAVPIGAVARLTNGYNNGNSFLANETMVKRMMRNNFDNSALTANTSMFGSSGGASNTNTVYNNLSTGFMGAYYGDAGGNIVPPANANSATAITRLLFQFVAHIPLSQLADFYRTAPSMQTLKNFELRLQSNLSTNNSWSVTYTAPATAGTNQLLVASATANNASVGSACPFMLSSAVYANNAANIFGQGLQISGTAAATTVTCTPFIGWAGQPATLTSNTPPISLGCRLWMPQWQLTSPYTSRILEKPVSRVIFSDYYAEVISVPAGAQQITRLLGCNLAHIRKLYIIPYFAAKAGATQPYKSLLSSAPTTCSYCKFSNVNLTLGGTNLLSEPLNFSNQFYENGLVQAISRMNGNAYDSDFCSGLITKSMWNKCYGVAVLDLKNVQDAVQDDGVKSINLSFKVDSSTASAHDFLILVTYENITYMDRVNGKLTDYDTYVNQGK